MYHFLYNLYTLHIAVLWSWTNILIYSPDIKDPALKIVHSLKVIAYSPFCFPDKIINYKNGYIV